MFETINFFVVIILILIIIIAYISWGKMQIFDHLVSGFYESDASFCQESGLDMFCIYLDDDIKNGERSCYILAKRNDDIIINEPCTVHLNLKCGSLYDTTPKYFTAEFKDISDECAEVFPRTQNLQYYPMIGKVILHDGDTVTFVGYKNGMNTEMKSAVDKKSYNDSE